MNPITISALTTHILGLFESDELLRDVWVAGEVSNWKRAASGHIYFNLKDSGATIASVMWRTAASGLRWQPQEGDQVLAHGYVGLYPERGAYQLYVNSMQPAGRGQLYAAFEALKDKLTQEGLFDVERKRAIPELVQRVGVVTSGSAAAFRDILRVASQRWPLLEIVLFPTLVQGADAPAQIVAALTAANRYSSQTEPLDLLILAHGGGSIEDLWSFNDEGVARAIAASELPVITGVGHETDFTIADFVADLRAPTPSAAILAATRSADDTRLQLAAIERVLAQSARQQIAFARNHVDRQEARLRRLHPERLLDLQRQRLDDRLRRLDGAIRRRLDRHQDRQGAALAALRALAPMRVLERGYSIVQKENGAVVTSPAESASGERLRVSAARGEYWVEHAR